MPLARPVPGTQSCQRSIGSAGAGCRYLTGAGRYRFGQLCSDREVQPVEAHALIDVDSELGVYLDLKKRLLLGQPVVRAKPGHQVNRRRANRLLQGPEAVELNDRVGLLDTREGNPSVL